MDMNGFQANVEEYIFGAERSELRADRMRVAIAVRNLLDPRGRFREWRFELAKYAVTTIEEELRRKYGEEIEASGKEAFFEGQKWNPVKFYKRSWKDANGRIPVFYAIDCNSNHFYEVYYGISKASEYWPYDGENVPKALEGVTGGGFKTSQHWVGWRYFAEPWRGMYKDEFLEALAEAGKDGWADLAKRHYADPFLKMVDETIDAVDAYNREIVRGSRE